MFKKALIGACLGLYALTGLAVPNITSVNGVVSEGNSVTANGSGFGTSGPTVGGSTDKVVLFDNFESGSNGSALSGTATVGSYTVFSGPTYTTANARSGTKSAFVNFSGGTLQSNNSIGIAFTAGQEFLLSFWQLVPAGKDIAGTNNVDGPNYKQWWSTTSGVGSEIADWVDVVIDNNMDGSLWEHANDPAWSGSSDCNYTTNHPIQPAKGTWVRRTWYQRAGNSGTGKMWYQNMNGSAQATGCINNAATTTYSSKLTNYMQIPGYARVDNNATVQMDNIYLAVGSNARSRVELCNNATYANATVCEISTATSWSDTAVTFTVRAGSFTSGTAYLFVVDSAGNANVTGQTVTIGGGSLLGGPTNVRRIPE